MADALVSSRFTDVARAPGQFALIARMWIRSSLSYPTSFAILTISSFLMTSLDFVAIALMFATIDTLGGFSLREIALLYGVSGLGIAVGDLVIGSVERIGTYVRTGALDTMMTRPVPLIVQICADNFALRRLGRLAQAGAVFAYGAAYVDWSPSKALLCALMLPGGALIFMALFIGISCIQFWTNDASEVANAFTYGGNTMTHYPLTIYPAEVAKSLTFVFPIAFVNWYPGLYLLDRPDPFGLPGYFAWLTLPVGLAMMTLAALAWRTGVRHYTSTGS